MPSVLFNLTKNWKHHLKSFIVVPLSFSNNLWSHLSWGPGGAVHHLSGRRQQRSHVWGFSSAASRCLSRWAADSEQTGSGYSPGPRWSSAAAPSAATDKHTGTRGCRLSTNESDDSVIVSSERTQFNSGTLTRGSPWQYPIFTNPGCVQ